MAISIRNIEKFFNDHPELADKKEEIMAKIRAEIEGDVILTGTLMRLIGNDLANQLLAEFEKKS